MAAKMAESCGDDGPKLGRWKGERGKGQGEGERGKGEGEGGGRKGEIGGRGEKWGKGGGKFEIFKNLARPLQRPVHVACFRPHFRSQGQQSACLLLVSKSTRQGSNLRPEDLQSPALPLSYWWLTIRGEKTTSKDYSASSSM